MPVIPPGYWMAAHQFDCPAPGGTRRSVITMGHQGPLIQENVAAVALSFAEEVWENMGSASYTYRGCVGYTEDTSNEAVVSLPGTLSAQPATPQVALLVRKVTGARGRENRGRNYYPGMVYESDVDAAGLINNAQAAGFQGFFNAWYTALNTLECEPYILHTELSDPTPVLSFEVDRVVATQRRRVRK